MSLLHFRDVSQKGPSLARVSKPHNRMRNGLKYLNISQLHNEFIMDATSGLNKSISKGVLGRDKNSIYNKASFYN